MLGTWDRRRRRRGVAATAAATAAMLALSACAGSGGASGGGGAGSSSKKISIGYSQAFSSNAWQQANNKAVETAVNVLKGEGKISDYTFLDANNNPNTQITQIQDLILKHVDVMIVNPSSSSALNGVLEKAMNAKIKVLVFSDGPVSDPRPNELVCDLESTGKLLTEYIGQRLNGHGDVLNVRGVAGTGGDASFQKGVDEALKEYPGLKVVTTVYGNWDNATTNSKVAGVLPGLPKIDAVIQQGGEGFGAAQAFQAASRPTPLIVMGNQGAELQWWSQQNKANGYTTLSIGTNPGIGAAAVYAAYDMATGKTLPQTMVYPNLTIKQADLDDYLDVPSDGQATKVYDAAWTDQNLLTQ
jgi:ribose transport system substrate-binding protein